VTDLSDSPPRERVERLLLVTRELVRELHPSALAHQRVDLNAGFDRDLGLDSLARVELFLRVERAFGVRLPEGLLAAADTPGDLLKALGELPGAQPPARARALAPPVADDVRPIIDTARTLVEALQWHAERNPDRLHIHLLAESDETVPITYAQLYREAKALAAGLQARGVRPAATVALMLPTSREFFVAFAGVLLAGAVPVPIYPPARLNQIEEHLRRQVGILNNAQTVGLITVAQAKPLARLLQSQVAALRFVTTTEDVSESDATPTIPSISGEDLALLQYTSGSTGNPKGVMLTHANLLANLRAMRDGLQVTPQDVFVSWLPLYHDMGLIGAWLGSMIYAYPLAIMSPLAFLSRPARWLQALHRFRGTFSAGPNFAYELCVSKIEDRELQGVDLSAWRLALNGAEPVSPATMARFIERFSRFGFRREAMLPVYGLAESSLGVTFPKLERGPLVDAIQRNPFATGGRALPADPNDNDVLRFVACGDALPGHAVRIVDDRDEEVGERIEGHLQFRGPSASRGYYRNPEETARMKHGDWLDSFDLAYRAGEDVYITGRVKDLIIRAGRNLYPYELETAIGGIHSVRKGCVAVFGSRDPRAGTERLVVVAETREVDPARRDVLTQEINALAVQLVGSPADAVVLAPPHSVLKTSSGKIRRSATRDRFERGELVSKPLPAWRQFVRLGVSGAGSAIADNLRRGARALYGGYAASAFVLCAFTAIIGARLAPSRRGARAFAQAMARAALRLMGLYPDVKGLDTLPREGACVMIANHSSYLDGVMLFAVLPREPSFVIKAELKSKWPVGPFLDKIGMRFVERFDAERSVEDARAMREAASAGESMVFFPEGTLRRQPGLLPFRTGAFLIAAQAGVPIVPIAVRGTRTALPEGARVPVKTPLSVEVAPPVVAGGDRFGDVIQLRDAVRDVILSRINEPDIVQPTETILTVKRG
jgi:1-acyl-sn-glycerol-3-phosphate acyltransferase